MKKIIYPILVEKKKLNDIIDLTDKREWYYFDIIWLKGSKIDRS